MQIFRRSFSRPVTKRARLLKKMEKQELKKQDEQEEGAADSAHTVRGREERSAVVTCTVKRRTGNNWITVMAAR